MVGEQHGRERRAQSARSDLNAQPAHNMDRAEHAYCRGQEAHGEHGEAGHRFPPDVREAKLKHRIQRP